MDKKKAWTDEEGEFNWIRLLRWVATGIVSIWLFCWLILGSYFMIQIGYAGVKFNQFTGKTTVVFSGTHLKIPSIDKIYKFDIKTLGSDTNMDCGTKDLQNIKLHLIVNYRILQDKVSDLFNKYGTDYSGKILNPAIAEIAKYSVSQYPLEGIILKRDELKQVIDKSLKERMKDYGFIIEQTNLVNIDFSEEFDKVIEQKQIEEQKIKVSENKRKQAEIDKQTVILIGEGEAMRQQLMQKTATQQIIALEWIKKWKGDVPHVITGGKEGVFLQMPIEK